MFFFIVVRVVEMYVNRIWLHGAEKAKEKEKHGNDEVQTIIMETLLMRLVLFTSIFISIVCTHCRSKHSLFLSIPHLFALPLTLSFILIHSSWNFYFQFVFTCSFAFAFNRSPPKSCTFYALVLIIIKKGN